jgi:NTP pyrophosphatase (non-canonical NTP hydrolase)
MKKEELYKKALEKWGMNLQLLMLIEESSEVIQATTKLIRNNKIPITQDYYIIKLAEEMADLEIMQEQTKLILGKDFQKSVRHYKKVKLERLQELLK